MTDGGVSKELRSPFFFSRPLSSRSSNIKGSNKDDLAEQRERDQYTKIVNKEKRR
jgi:hypothetical protein